MAQLSLDLTGYALIQAQRSASKLTHAPYGSKLTPVHHNLERLFHQETVRLPRLKSFNPAAFVDAETGRTIPVPDMAGLIASAIAENPADMAARKADLSSAILYEMSRYGCILLAANPYSAMLQASEQAAA